VLSELWELVNRYSYLNTRIISLGGICYTLFLCHEIFSLGGKIVFIDVMVVEDPLDFALLLGRDYVYAMKAIVSTFSCDIFPSRWTSYDC
jgi:hypothetical protein